MDIRHKDFQAIIEPDAVFEQLATGFKFTEGPVWHAIEQTVLFSDIAGNKLHRWSSSIGLETVRPDSRMANGNVFDAMGRLVTCEHAASRVTRSDLLTGAYQVLASHYEGKELNSPNDIIVKRDGRIYFTDPDYGRMPGNGIVRDRELPYCGVYRVDPETGALLLLVDDFVKPNGLCFSLDESLLYVNDTTCQHIRVFDVSETGELENGRLFVELRGGKAGAADGMKIDSQGNLYSCGPGGVHVFTAGGVCLGVIETPEVATNLVFGDEDLCSLFITAMTSLYRIRVKIPGHDTFDFLKAAI